MFKVHAALNNNAAWSLCGKKSSDGYYTAGDGQTVTCAKCIAKLAKK